MIFELTKDVVEELMAQKGEAGGTTFKTDERFIVSVGGEKKLEEVEDEIKKAIGHDFKYGEINAMAFYPLGLRAISILATAKVFDMDDEGIRKMGSSAPKVSAIVRLFTHYFLSISKMFEQVSRIWARHYTKGELEPLEINEKKKFFILRLKNFNVHPVLCVYLSGYFLKLSEMVIKSDVIIEETDCPFRGSESHDFKVKW